MLRQGSWISRLAAFGILALVLLAGHQFLVSPLMARFSENEQQILQKSKLLEHYRALAHAEPALAERIAAAQRRDDGVGGYWEGGSDVQTAAKLQDRVSESVETHGGDVISVETIAAGDADATGGVRETRLRARISVTQGGLASILHDLESATPYMFIDRLAVTSNRSWRKTVRAEAGEQEPRLDVRLDVFGYVRGFAPPDEIAEAGG